MGTHIGDIIEPIEGKVIQRIESPTNGIIFTAGKSGCIQRCVDCPGIWRKSMKKIELYRLKASTGKILL